MAGEQPVPRLAPNLQQRRQRRPYVLRQRRRLRDLLQRVPHTMKHRRAHHEGDQPPRPLLRFSNSPRASSSVMSAGQP